MAVCDALLYLLLTNTAVDILEKTHTQNLFFKNLRETFTSRSIAVNYNIQLVLFYAYVSHGNQTNQPVLKKCKYVSFSSHCILPSLETQVPHNAESGQLCLFHTGCLFLKKPDFCSHHYYHYYPSFPWPLCHQYLSTFSPNPGNNWQR